MHLTVHGRGVEGLKEWRTTFAQSERSWVLFCWRGGW